ncbi:hypothetical protein CSV80_00830 [Sporosarcina sp. P12(2017)]|uniref:hypothetical protein n=2 Tax=unclassified Sporosarcina TaxID=2647733 RepID=UPI000C17332F|nr:hypothetical protein [Sporosarcina sp. P10]PIC59100.1 hypothetical protein CSV81_00830 [Sporosarcina sp. P10]PIC62421.1 hypothetical protein CSV80_00830 [Sporosarcina sp. P12(2017)]
MKNIVAMRRKHTQWSIDQNPVMITVNRREKVNMGGYMDEIQSTTGPFIVRVFTSGGSPQEISTLAGQKQVDRHFSLLADYQTDIRAGTIVIDEFEAHGMIFQVKAIYPQTVAGEIVGYQGELERVT